MGNLAAPMPINEPQGPALPAIQPQPLEEVVVAAGKTPPHYKNCSLQDSSYSNIYTSIAKTAKKTIKKTAYLCFIQELITVKND